MKEKRKEIWRDASGKENDYFVALKKRREASKKALEFRKKHTLTCWQKIWEIIQSDIPEGEDEKAAKMTFAEKTLLASEFYSKAKNNNSNPPETRTIVAIAVGYGLGLPMTIELLRLAGRGFNPTSDEHDAFEFALTDMLGEPIEKVNIFLESENIKPLGSKMQLVKED